MLSDILNCVTSYIQLCIYIKWLDHIISQEIELKNKNVSEQLQNL